MATEWIKMRTDLREDPAVMRMAELMEINEICIVGYCHTIWSWMSRQCHADSVTGVTLESLGRVTGTGRFPEFMAQVGWLEEVEINGVASLKIPHFDRWLSESAKKRGLAAIRKQNQRSRESENVTQMSRSERDKSVTREEKSREEKNKTPTACESSRTRSPQENGSDLEGLPPEVIAAWNRWLDYALCRDGHRNPIVDQTNLADLVRYLAEYGPTYVVEAIDRSIKKQSKNTIYWSDLTSSTKYQLPADFKL